MKQNSNNQWHILVVDDDPGYLLSVGDMLRDKLVDVHIDTAATVEGGIRHASQHHYHIAIVDMHMPLTHEDEENKQIDELAGVKLMTKIKNIRKFKVGCEQIVIFTAWPSLEDAFQTARAGASGYIPKDNVVLTSGSQPTNTPGGLEELGKKCVAILEAQRLAAETT